LLKRGFRAIAAFACVAACPVHAQDAPPPVGPAAIEVPSLEFVATPRDERDYLLYFFFHKPGMSFEQALSDLTECYAEAESFQLPWIPYFSLLDDAAITPKGVRPQGNSFGLMGAVFAALVDDHAPINVYEVQPKVRMCMGYKEYTRYGATRAIWKAIGGDGVKHAVLVLAKIASGPAPSARSIEP
jgi:hypothetical protein